MQHLKSVVIQEISLDTNCNDSLFTTKFNVFICYQWPHKTHISQYVFEFIKEIYPVRGMLRKCTIRRGGFELVGPREQVRLVVIFVVRQVIV